MLITILIIALVALIVCYVIDLLPLPGNILMIAKIIVALIALMKILGAAGINIPGI